MWLLCTQVGIDLIIAGIILYIVGLALAGGPRHSGWNWAGTILSVLGIAMFGLALYGEAFV